VLSVNAGNNPPTLNPISNLTIAEDAGTQTVSLSGISSGAVNETQTLTLVASSSNPSLIPNPAVSYVSPNTSGTLTFTPVANANGTARLDLVWERGAFRLEHPDIGTYGDQLGRRAAGVWSGASMSNEMTSRMTRIARDSAARVRRA
jgi:hypothetical protein